MAEVKDVTYDAPFSEEQLRENCKQAREHLARGRRGLQMAQTKLSTLMLSGGSGRQAAEFEATLEGHKKQVVYWRSVVEGCKEAVDDAEAALEDVCPKPATPSTAMVCSRAGYYCELPRAVPRALRRRAFWRGDARPQVLAAHACYVHTLRAWPTRVAGFLRRGLGGGLERFRRR
jgi:hypothetical protein